MIVDLPEAQMKALARLEHQRNVSRAALVKEAIREYLERHANDSQEAFGLWKARDIDSLGYQKSLRSEWE